MIIAHGRKGNKMAKRMITQTLKATFEYESDKYYDSIEEMCKHEKLDIPVLNVYGQRWHCVSFVKRVIINNPATIVLWEDGTKTICKCAEGDTFDAEKGIAMCFLKKMFGNPSQVRKFIGKWAEENEPYIEGRLHERDK